MKDYSPEEIYALIIAKKIMRGQILAALSLYIEGLSPIQVAELSKKLSTYAINLALSTSTNIKEEQCQQAEERFKSLFTLTYQTQMPKLIEATRRYVTRKSSVSVPKRLAIWGFKLIELGLVDDVSLARLYNILAKMISDANTGTFENFKKHIGKYKRVLWEGAGNIRLGINDEDAMKNADREIKEALSIQVLPSQKK